MGWMPVKLNEGLRLSVREEAARVGMVAFENLYHSDEGGVSRFPGTVIFADNDKFPESPNSPMYLYGWRNDLMAVSGTGQAYRLDPDGNVENVTDVPVSGGGRPIFDKTEREMLVAAGGPIIAFSGNKTRRLSDQAPDSTHVVFIAGRVIAIEKDSERFLHTAVGDYETWDPLDTFSAEGKPDNITAAAKSEYSELFLAGPESIEQFDIQPVGDIPFFRRGELGTGIYAPYTLLAAQSSMWCLDKNREFVRMLGAIPANNSKNIQRRLTQEIKNWDGAWTQEISVGGHTFIILQAPKAQNPYDTMGYTLAYEVDQDRWCELYGWDPSLNVPTRWPGVSAFQIWGETFIGGYGRVCRMDPTIAGFCGNNQRAYLRTANFSARQTGMTINNVRLEVVRGIGEYGGSGPILRLRANKDGRGFGRYIERRLGAPGQRRQAIFFGQVGTCDTCQLELQMFGMEPLEIVSLSVDVQGLEQ